MKTSYCEIIKTEKYLRGKMRPEDSLVFQARLLLDKDLERNTLFHRIVHRMVTLYFRKKLKREIQAAHTRLFNDPLHAGFKDEILKNFIA